MPKRSMLAIFSPELESSLFVAAPPLRSATVSYGRAGRESLSRVRGGRLWVLQGDASRIRT